MNGEPVVHSFWAALFANPFLRTALLSGVALSFMSGMIGPYIVSKRIVFIAGSISHAVLGGIGLFVFLHSLTHNAFFTPLLGALFASCFFGALIGLSHIYFKQREDTVIAAIWSIGMSFGVLCMSMIPAAGSRLLDFLFGNLLWAVMEDVYRLIFLDVCIFIICCMCHKRFLAISFDEEQARLQRQPVIVLYFLLLFMTSIAIVFMIQTTGAVLMITMLSLPAALASFMAKKLSIIIILSVLFSFFFFFCGIYIAYQFNWPPGASIAFITALIYFLSLPLKGKFIKLHSS